VHCWHSPVDLPNQRPPHISRWAGWSVCSLKSRPPPPPPGRSYRSPRSRSCRVGTAGTSEPPGGSDMTAGRGVSRTKRGAPAALEEWRTPPSLLLLWCTSPGSPTWIQDLVPMETTGSRQCGTETEQRRPSRSSLCSSVSSSSLFLFSLSSYY